MYAIGHPLEAVRIAAAEELKKRPREDYVPLLLACARFPVEFACNVLASAGLTAHNIRWISRDWSRMSSLSILALS